MTNDITVSPYVVLTVVSVLFLVLLLRRKVTVKGFKATFLGGSVSADEFRVSSEKDAKPNTTDTETEVSVESERNLDT